MSIVTLAYEHPKARKAHRCDDCGRVIQPGEVYNRQTNVGDDGLYVWKSCSHCEVIAHWVLTKDGPGWYDDGLCISDWMSDCGRDYPNLYAQYASGYVGVAAADLAIPVVESTNQ